MAIVEQETHFASGEAADHISKLAKVGHDCVRHSILRGQIARFVQSFFAASLAFGVLTGSALAQGTDDPTVTACKSTGLLALQEKSKDITDLVIDMESVAVSKSDTKVEDVPIKTVVLGEAYIARNGKTGTPDRFVCLLGDKGKVLLTFFTAK